MRVDVRERSEDALAAPAARAPRTNGETTATGEGWVLKAETLLRAQRGVMPAHASRVGRRLRDREANRTGRGGGIPRVSDEQRGARFLIYEAYRNYVQQGIIDTQGDWIRLARNPSRRPRHHWHEALLHFLAEAHPTLDGKWHRPPKKTVRGVWEETLGRKLEPWEHPRRRPGSGRTWDPSDLLLLDYNQGTIATLADIAAGQTGSSQNVSTHTPYSSA